MQNECYWIFYHGIESEYLQNDLNEFCYKFNQKYFGENLFDRPIIASVYYKNHFRCHLGYKLIPSTD